jgi:PAS domain S-box-containing protein
MPLEGPKHGFLPCVEPDVSMTSVTLIDASPPAIGGRSAWSRLVRDGLCIGALALIYFITARLGLRLALVHDSATAVWPPTGISLAALLLLGYRLWPGVLLGAFVANVVSPMHPLPAAGIAVGNTLEAVAAAWMVNHFAHGRAAFSRAPYVFRFIILVPLFGTTLSATIGPIMLAVSGLAQWADFGQIALTWWLGDSISALVITPLLLVWLGQPWPAWKKSLAIEGVGLLLLVVVCSVAVFSEGDLPRTFLRPFLLVPILIWASYRYEQRGATVCLLIVSSICIWGTLQDHGAFALQQLNDSLVLAQLFVGTAAVTALILAALVSQRRRMEEDLQRSEAFGRRRLAELAAVYRDAPVGLCFMDTDLRYVKINERLAAINGRPVLDHIGRTIREVLPELADTVEACSRQVLTTGEPVLDLEITGTTPADPGVQHAWLASYSPVKDQAGEVLGVNTVVQDITELKRFEIELQHHRERLEDLVQERTEELEQTHERLRLSERMAAMGTFSAGIGHDMANLLFPICARAEVLGAMELTPAASEHITAISNCVMYLQNLAKGLRLFALDPEEPAPEESTDLRLWQAQVQPFMRMALPRGVALRWELADSSPRLAISAHALTQAVYNLVQNAGVAVRGRRDGWVCVAATNDELNAMVHVSVADNGVGMTNEVKRRCLEPFFTTKQRGMSTGLGLALVHGVVRRAGGSIDIRTAPGSGTTFVLNLPAASGRARAAARSSAARPVSAAVTVKTERLRAYVESLLRTFDVALVNGSAGGQAHADIWIAEHRAAVPEAIQTALHDAHCRVCLLIDNGTHAADIADDDRLTVVDVRQGFSHLHSAVRKLVEDAAARGGLQSHVVEVATMTPTVLREA